MLDAGLDAARAGQDTASTPSELAFRCAEPERARLEARLRLMQWDGHALPLGRALLEAGFADGTLRLRLLAGERAALFRLALELQGDGPLPLAFPLGEPLKAPALDLPAASGAAEAFRHLVGAGLDHLLANADPAARGEAEGVHQLRVALRRLRSALVLFAPVLARLPADLLGTELRRLGRVFGQARDWDVFRLETLPALRAAAPDTPGLSRLDQAVLPEWRAAHAALAAELASPAFTGLVLGLGGWAGDHLTLSPPDMPMHDLAPMLLDRLARKVERRGRHAPRLHGARLHDLRKALKKLRYAADDLAGLYPPKPVRRFLHPCKAVQEALGRINDANAAEQLCRQLATGRPELAPPLGALARWAEARRDAARLEAAWAEFRDAPPFWR